MADVVVSTELETVDADVDLSDGIFTGVYPTESNFGEIQTGVMPVDTALSKLRESVETLKRDRATIEEDRSKYNRSTPQFQSADDRLVVVNSDLRKAEVELNGRERSLEPYTRADALFQRAERDEDITRMQVAHDSVVAFMKEMRGRDQFDDALLAARFIVHIVEVVRKTENKRATALDKVRGEQLAAANEVTREVADAKTAFDGAISERRRLEAELKTAQERLKEVEKKEESDMDSATERYELALRKATEQAQKNAVVAKKPTAQVGYRNGLVNNQGGRATQPQPQTPTPTAPTPVQTTPSKAVPSKPVPPTLVPVQPTERPFLSIDSPYTRTEVNELWAELNTTAGKSKANNTFTKQEFVQIVRANARVRNVFGPPAVSGEHFTRMSGRDTVLTLSELRQYLSFPSARRKPIATPSTAAGVFDSIMSGVDGYEISH